jgi:hypothetical protein
MEPVKIDLNAPAFGTGAQKVEVASDEPVGESEKPNEEEQQVETQVPYSRFKKYHDLAKEAQEEAERYRREADELRSQPERVVYDKELPEQWKKLYGDTEQSREAWKLQLELQRELREETMQEAREAVRNERYEEVERTEANLEIIDDNFEQLGDFIGRDLTETEQSSVLDAVDYLTPKDRYGNYAGPLVPFEADWDYVQAKQGRANSSRSQSRNQVAAASASQSQGSPILTETEEKNKNYNPLNWNAYKDRI